jgi:aminoglycoside phosphotransferase (APT) family kinase protein
VINEQRWLPSIAPRLPWPVPTPIWTGRPHGSYPWPWSITRWFDGQPMHTVPAPERLAYAGPLGYFLARVHFPAPGDAPRNPYRGIPLPQRDDLLASQLDVLDGAQLRAVRRLWPALAASPPWCGPPLWLHGDPHPGNVVVRRDQLVAMIDFGDLTAGDPATDLALGWLGLEARGRRLLADTYAGAGYLHRDTWARARGWALCLSVALIAHSDDNPALATIGQHGLHQVLTDG